MIIRIEIEKSGGEMHIADSTSRLTYTFEIKKKEKITEVEVYRGKNIYTRTLVRTFKIRKPKAFGSYEITIQALVKNLSTFLYLQYINPGIDPDNSSDGLVKE